jgi:hypothetical protein
MQVCVCVCVCVCERERERERDAAGEDRLTTDSCLLNPAPFFSLL